LLSKATKLALRKTKEIVLKTTSNFVLRNTKRVKMLIYCFGINKELLA
jgi:hypothetical protein